MGDGMSRGPYQWARAPKVYKGMLRLTFADGTSELRSANSVAWDPWEEPTARAMLKLAPHDDADERTHFNLLGDLQAEDKSVTVAVRRVPGYKDSGVETAELESKDQQIARLQEELKTWSGTAKVLNIPLSIDCQPWGKDTGYLRQDIVNQAMVYQKGVGVAPVHPGITVWNPMKYAPVSVGCGDYKVTERKLAVHWDGLLDDVR